MNCSGQELDVNSSSKQLTAVFASTSLASLSSGRTWPAALEHTTGPGRPVDIFKPAGFLQY